MKNICETIRNWTPSSAFFYSKSLRKNRMTFFNMQANFLISKNVIRDKLKEIVDIEVKHYTWYITFYYLL